MSKKELRSRSICEFLCRIEGARSAERFCVYIIKLQQPGKATSVICKEKAWTNMFLILIRSMT